MNGCWVTFVETQLATHLSSEDSAERLLFRGKKEEMAEKRAGVLWNASIHRPKSDSFPQTMGNDLVRTHGDQIASINSEFAKLPFGSLG